MRYRVIVLKKLPAAGMAIYPFVLLKEQRYKLDKTLIQHECIHLKQQLELLIIPFYLLYLLQYLFNLIKYRGHWMAYHNIVFEKEAYAFESDSDYLKKRGAYAWLRFFGQKRS